MKIAITGHRPERLLSREGEVKEWVRESIRKYKGSDFLCGMARGVDQIGALAAIAEKIKLHCYFPYKHKLSDMEQFLVDKADEVIWCEDKYSGPDCYFKRDRRMVDDCDLLLVVWDGIKSGGTYYTYKYAVEQGKDVVIFPWKDNND